MKAQEKIRTIETQLINRLCWVPNPEKILPHLVFIEDVNDNGEPEYQRCTIEAIHPENQTCTLHNHVTNERSSEWYLRSIPIDWLVTLWEWYKENSPDDIDIELQYLIERGKWYERLVALFKEYIKRR